MQVEKVLFKTITLSRVDDVHLKMIFYSTRILMGFENEKVGLELSGEEVKGALAAL